MLSRDSSSDDIACLQEQRKVWTSLNQRSFPRLNNTEVIISLADFTHGTSAFWDLRLWLLCRWLTDLIWMGLKQQTCFSNDYFTLPLPVKLIPHCESFKHTYSLSLSLSLCLCEIRWQPAFDWCSYFPGFAEHLTLLRPNRQSLWLGEIMYSVSFLLPLRRQLNVGTVWGHERLSLKAKIKRAHSNLWCHGTTKPEAASLSVNGRQEFVNCDNVQGSFLGMSLVTLFGNPTVEAQFLILSPRNEISILLICNRKYVKGKCTAVDHSFFLISIMC